jgi:hypothetical protein
LQEKIKENMKQIENMKTRINHIVAVTFFALFILVGNVNAKGTELDASSHENIEATLELENWMINDNFWVIEATIILEKENEASLELENWMTNDTTWEMKDIVNFETETEKTLGFEPWMTNENIWNN